MSKSEPMVIMDLTLHDDIIFFLQIKLLVLSSYSKDSAPKSVIDIINKYEKDGVFTYCANSFYTDPQVIKIINDRRKNLMFKSYKNLTINKRMLRHGILHRYYIFSS